MLDGRVLEASQVEYKPFGKPPLQREKLGKSFFRDKYYEYLVHVPVIGRRRSGRNSGAGYERRDWLPVNELGGATRHPAHLTEEQVAQRVCLALPR